MLCVPSPGAGGGRVSWSAAHCRPSPRQSQVTLTLAPSLPQFPSHLAQYGRVDTRLLPQCTPPPRFSGEGADYYRAFHQNRTLAMELNQVDA